jgi:TM2 domain-containing membrane protein YozV
MKNKIAAGILALTVGGFGVHRFYLGQVGLGIFYLLFFWTGIPWLIGWIDGILMLTTSEDEFNFKYNKDYYHTSKNRNNQPSYNQRHSNPDGRPSYNKYQEREEERERQRQRQSSQQYTTNRDTNTSNSVNNPYKDEGTRLYRDYDFKGAIKSYQMALKVNPNDSIVHFNLACLFSLEEQKEHAYLHLSKAVENGFAMYDKIRSHDHLAYLRTDAGFETFVANGYRQPAAYGAPLNQLPPRQEFEIDLMSDEVMNKLEQLGKLKDRGLLTEAEFNLQKAKLLMKK